MKGEGHFLALLQKGETEESLSEKASNISSGKKKIPEDIQQFFQNVSWQLQPERLDIHGERVYYMPENLPDMRGIRFLRTGLLLGELKKNRFEPSQALAMYLKASEFAHTISLSAEDERITRYLKGETIEVDDLTTPQETGWHLVCVDGYPLGWGKLNQGTLKNKYLPGWRNQSS